MGPSALHGLSASPVHSLWSGPCAVIHPAVQAQPAYAGQAFEKGSTGLTSPVFAIQRVTSGVSPGVVIFAAIAHVKTLRTSSQALGWIASEEAAAICRIIPRQFSRKSPFPCQMYATSGGASAPRAFWTPHGATAAARNCFGQRHTRAKGMATCKTLEPPVIHTARITPLQRLCAGLREGVIKPVAPASKGGKNGLSLNRVTACDQALWRLAEAFSACVLSGF